MNRYVSIDVAAARQGAIVLVGVLMVSGCAATDPAERRIYLYDGYGHHGSYYCGVDESDGGVTTTCTAPRDEIVYEEVQDSEGTVRRSWFAEGTFEYARSIQRRGQEEIHLERGTADCWVDPLGRAVPPDETPPWGGLLCKCKKEADGGTVVSDGGFD